MLEKSFAIHADNVTYDLEDSVAPSSKPPPARTCAPSYPNHVLQA